MSKILSKLIRKIPPFRTIFARLDYLDGECKKNVNTINELQSKFISAANELVSVKKELKKTKEELKTTKEELKEAKTEQTAINEQITTQGEMQKKTDKQMQDTKNRIDSLQKKEETDNKNMYQQLFATQKELSKDINYYYLKGLHPDQYEENLKENYYLKTGEVLDLGHPKTYNEKIQWLKLYGKNPLVTKLSDKYQVRAWIADKIGEQYLIPLLGVYDSFDDIDFEQLPNQFVIKTNHASSSNRIVRDKSTMDYKKLKRFFDYWMHRNFAFCNALELQYKPIIPKIIIEEYMENNGKELNDYKIMCFHGKAYYIMYYTNRGHGTKMAIFDREWNLMPFTHSYPQYTEPVPKPERLEELLRLAEILSDGFIHVRVDFYILDDGSIRFGEMTFTSSSGTSPWEPKEYDRILGDYMKLPIEEKP